MKILHLSDYYPNRHKIWGGAEQACSRIIELLKSRFRITLGTTKPLREIGGGLESFVVPTWEQFFSRRIVWRYITIKELLFPFDPFSFFYTLCLIARGKFDAVHLHRINYISFAPLLSAKLLGKPVIFSVYDYWCVCPRLMLIREDNAPCADVRGSRCRECAARLNVLEKLLVRMRKKGYDFFLRRIDRFHVLSRSSRDILVSCGIPENKIKIVPLPSPAERSPLNESREIEPVLLFVGWIEQRKGLDMLVKAFALISSKNPSMRLVIAGGITDQGYFDSINRYIKENGLGDRISYLGKLPFDQIREHVRKATAILVAEQWHNMSPVIITEAMTYGIPVVAGNIGGIPEFVEDGKTGFLAVYNDPQSYAEKIQRLLNDSPAAERMGRSAREKIIAMSNDGIIADKLQEMYNELVRF